LVLLVPDALPSSFEVIISVPYQSIIDLYPLSRCVSSWFGVENLLALDRRLFVLNEHRYSSHETAVLSHHNHSQNSLPLVMSRGPRKPLLQFHKAEKSSGQHVPITIPSKWLSCCFCYTNNEE
jgi:hypothetical protein